MNQVNSEPVLDHIDIFGPVPQSLVGSFELNKATGNLIDFEFKHRDWVSDTTNGIATISLKRT